MTEIGDRRRASTPQARTDVRGQIEAAMLLRTLLPVARARMATEAGDFEQNERSPLMRAMWPFLRVENLTGVHLYQTVDGWYADITFRTMPAGVPNALGVPANYPLKTAAAAREMATMILMTVLIAEAEGEAPDSGKRQFDLDGLYVAMPADVLPRVQALAAEHGVDRDLSEIRLRQMLSEDFPGETTEAGWWALPEERRGSYLVFMCVLLSVGIFRLLRKEPAMHAAADVPVRAAP